MSFTSNLQILLTASINWAVLTSILIKSPINVPLFVTHDELSGFLYNNWYQIPFTSSNVNTGAKSQILLDMY